MTDSSDDDSFHSASDGEQNHDQVEVRSTASLNAAQSSEKEATSFTDSKGSKDSKESKESKESNDDFEKVEPPVKQCNDVVFKVPKPPCHRLPSSSNTAAKRSSGLSSESEDEKGTKKSIWNWTGIHDVVSAVGEGLSSAVEVSLGLPSAEEMARLSVAERRKLLEEAQYIKEPEPSLSSDEGGIGEHELFRPKKSSTAREHQFTRVRSGEAPTSANQSTSGGMGGFFSTGSLFSNLVSAPLDVLESLGKKTFETLTVKDQNEDGGEKRRFFLHGVSASEGQSLSQVLRELRDESLREEANDSTSKGHRSLMGCENRFNTSFVSLFEKNEGMVHLEGLELLSRDQERRTKGMAESPKFNKVLTSFCVEDVSECLTEDFDLEFPKHAEFISLPFKPDDVLETNRRLTHELTLRQDAVDATEEVVVEAIHEAAMTALAKLTAHSIGALHKIAQLIVITKKLPDADSLLAFTYMLCRRLSFFATQYSNILNVMDIPEESDEVVTNIFFECSNACHDIKKAFELLRPFFRGH